MSNQKALQKLQKRYCISRIGGDINLLDRKQIRSIQSGAHASEIHFYSKSSGDILIKRYLESLAVACKPQDVISDFWLSPSTLMYDLTAFTPLSTPATTLNFWSGHTVMAAKGDCRIIEDFLYKVICSEDDQSYQYLFSYLSHMLQKPHEKPGVVPVLIGGQGTGKGVFFQLLQCIWANTTLLVNNIDEVVGRFNGQLERNYVVCMDEALFAGDRRSLDRLKSFVTEPRILIEQKYQPSRSIQSHHRFFAATNHDHFAHIERDDRRFLFLRVSACRQQNTAYFTELSGRFEDGETLPALIALLMDTDLTSFDVRKRPETREHIEQRLKSLIGFERYWYEVLETCRFIDHEYGQTEWEDAMFVQTSEILRIYKRVNRNAERHESVQAAEVAKLIKRLCPSALKTTKRLKFEHLGYKQRRGFALPDINTARKDFEGYLGCPIRWEDS